MKLIGLIGRARSGKDTVAGYLAMQHKFTHAAFADPMKEMLEVAFGNINFRDGDREQPIDWLGKSPRQLMQTLATEWGRDLVHEDLWTMLTEQKVKNAVEFNLPLVISDVRFHNEADMILKHGGELWHIQRDTAETVNAHVSEQYSWDTYQTKTLDNNGSLAELFLQVEEAYQGEAFTRFIEQVKVFSQETQPKLCRCDHKLQGTGAVFYQSTKLLQCSNCHGWQQVRKPIEV
tara:strand:- start:1349 stop:2047 length:699 start_codon:yes stop_codon:yes gene_type:complete